MGNRKDSAQDKINDMSETEKDTVISFLIGMNVGNVEAAIREVDRQNSPWEATVSTANDVDYRPGI